MNKAVFLDRDGTINIDEGYTYKTEDLEFYDDVFESLKKLSHFKLFIVTNQSGIGRGYYSYEDFKRFNDKLVLALSENGINIEKTYCCPHSPEENCDCRKPNIRYLKEAEKEFDIDLKRSWVIGDHPHDVTLGKNAGARSIYLLTGHGQKHREDLSAKPELIANSLSEAAEFIIQNDNHN
ncbi:MAG: HAD family hydrolase [Nanoarchaeota archaeon]|nr:HAD family hydrolase [Nanoarchaeota archaeon]MBU1704591.1 HAD family hydrolase [Nanoarchaeota archaeon]